MAKSFTLAGMALAATGLALSAPAAAAPAAHSAAAPAGTSLTSSYAAPSVFHQPTAQFDRERRGRYDRDDRRYRGRGYDRNSRYDQPVRHNTRVWRGDDGRAYCKKDDGTTGLLIGAGVGALIGNEVAGRGDRTLGAILGAAGGALLGREIDRSGARCR